MGLRGTVCHLYFFMARWHSIKRQFAFFLLALSLALPSVTLASVTDGTIDGTNKYATFVESGVGRVNFGTADGNVHITDSAITGYGWSETFGWINLSPSGAGVANDGEGNLSGYAWGEQTGWINFDPANGGVTISSAGVFSGYAWAQNVGWLSFNCSDRSVCATDDYKVVTDWRPRSARPACNNASDDDSDGSTDYPADAGCSSLTDTDETNSAGGGGGGAPGAPGAGTTDTTPTTPATPPATEPPATEPPITPPTTEPPTTEPTTPSETPATPSENPSTGGETGGGESTGGSGGGFTAPVIDLLSSAREQIRESFAFAGETARVIADETRRIVESPTGSVVTKAVSTIGVVGGGAITASALFLNPLSFSELILIPLRLWALLLTAFGLKKRRLPWGTVYDSITKQPLDPAYVVLSDLNGKEINTSITDLDGRYGFLLAPGTYRIVANKTNYIFPSKRLAGRQSDELYKDLYFGEPIQVDEMGAILTKNIPLDPEKFDWNEFAKGDKKLMSFYSRRDRIIKKFSDIMFVLGFAVAAIAFMVAPQPYNIGIFVLYIFLFLMRVLGLKPKASGSVTEKTTGEPLSFAIVRIYSVALGRELMHRIADKFGRYYALVPQGQYYITVERKNADESYTMVYTSPVMEAKRGVINQSVEV